MDAIINGIKLGTSIAVTVVSAVVIIVLCLLLTQALIIVMENIFKK